MATLASHAHPTLRRASVDTPGVPPGILLCGVAHGALAGLTVYAVPQVIAAASPLGALAAQTGTLVKLVRVLMLGPVCLVPSPIAPRLAPQAVPDGEMIASEAIAGETAATRPSMAHLVPWFIIGFLALVACRSLGLGAIGLALLVALHLL